MNETITIEQVFQGRARKFNHFMAAEQSDPAHSCAGCVRRAFSFPYTCNDGWPAGDPQWQDRGADCLNWTDQGNAQVD